MVVVIKRKGETKENMFRKFTRSFIEEDIVTDVRKKQFHKKPSLLKKEKEKERLRGSHGRKEIKKIRRIIK